MLPAPKVRKQTNVEKKVEMEVHSFILLHQIFRKPLNCAKFSDMREYTGIYSIEHVRIHSHSTAVLIQLYSFHIFSGVI